MIGPTCPDCDRIHLRRDAVLVGSRFDEGALHAYRASSGGPLRATREQAEADECQRRRDTTERSS